jgi:hydrogenase maturation protease
VKTLVLGLGNELLSDDAIGVLAARALASKISCHGVNVVESALSGMALLDLFIGYERAIIIDAIQTGQQPAGTILELTPSDLSLVVAPSPHYAGLPELLAIAKELQLDFPRRLKILAVEVADLHTIGARLSPPVERALPRLIERVLAELSL